MNLPQISFPWRQRIAWCWAVLALVGSLGANPIQQAIDYARSGIDPDRLPGRYYEPLAKFEGRRDQELMLPLWEFLQGPEVFTEVPVPRSAAGWRSVDQKEVARTILAKSEGDVAGLVIRALSSPDPVARREDALLLPKLPFPVLASVSPLEKLLGEGERDTRVAAIRALASQGSLACEPLARHLRKAMDSGEDWEASEVAFSLYGFGVDRATLLPLLSDYLDASKYSEMKISAIASLAEHLCYSEPSSEDVWDLLAPGIARMKSQAEAGIGKVPSSGRELIRMQEWRDARKKKK